MLKIDPEFRSLIPAPSKDELEQLEANLRTDGCREPLAVWNGIIIDGHHRHEKCERLGIGYTVRNIDLPDRDSAKIWIIQNQFGRRNLSDFARADLALKLEPLVSEKSAKQKTANLLRGNEKPQKPQCFPVPPNLGERGHAKETNAQIAVSAGVSRNTIAKVKKIKKTAAPEVVEMAKDAAISIDAAVKVATLPKEEQKALAEAGPAAVKAKAVEMRNQAEPSAKVDPERPWGAFEGQIMEVVGKVRVVAKLLNKILEADAATKRLCCQWAACYGHGNTIGAANKLAMALIEGLPAKVVEKSPGFICRSQLKIQEGARK